jgi:amino acid transporter
MSDELQESAANSVGPTDQERHGRTVAEDILLLNSLGYGQELLRRMSGFSNFAISLSIICILAGGITSFPQGFSSVGGAAIGLGWPVCCLLSLCVALAMAQLASAFPTAGGLYHWAAILGGRGWGWLTAWFNLAGLITALAAINVGTYQFGLRALCNLLNVSPAEWLGENQLTAQVLGVLAITSAQAFLNHLGIRLTAALTDFSGYWILFFSIVLTGVMLAYAPTLDFSRLITFANYSGTAGGNIWPREDNVAWLFLLGFLLPAYTVTGFDASAHTSEETVGASHHVPRGIVRSVLVSGVFGWVMLSAIVLAIPDMNEAARHGSESFHWIVGQILPKQLWSVLALGIVIAQFFCGLATVTSASRMAYAFARDGGLPFSAHVRSVSRKYRTPAVAIWSVALLSVAFVVHTQTYSTITGACTIFLYISYVIPTALGLVVFGRSWTHMGPWNLGGTVYRAVAVLSILGCGLILLVGIQPPNDQNLWTVLGALALTAVVWIGYERSHFRGPPQGVLNRTRASDTAAPRPVEVESG